MFLLVKWPSGSYYYFGLEITLPSVKFESKGAGGKKGYRRCKMLGMVLLNSKSYYYYCETLKTRNVDFCNDQSQSSSGNMSKPQNHKLITVAFCSLIFFFTPDWLFPCNRITLHKYSWCSWFFSFTVITFMYPRKVFEYVMPMHVRPYLGIF